MFDRLHVLIVHAFSGPGGTNSWVGACRLYLDYDARARHERGADRERASGVPSRFATPANLLIMPDLEAALASSLAAGRPVARAIILRGPGTGRTLLIWPAGEIMGSLGSPRLNQRIALYAEAQFTKNWNGTLRKKFDQEGEILEVEFVVFRPETAES